jgi:hypothetical protein
MINEKWTVEVNLDDDARYPNAYHIDTQENTLRNNLRRALTKDNKVERWVIVAIAEGALQANDYCDKIRIKMNEQYKDEPRSEDNKDQFGY